MALSQLQCLDEGNINYRTNESKPEFYYSEPQRLAVETLLAGGAEAFNETVTKENLRTFLSELDIEQILCSVRDFLPEELDTDRRVEKGRGEGEDEKVKEGPEKKPLSLCYWPDSSDISRPGLDLGWPDSGAYRGVTRANVYTQPPVEGSVHIKEMVRRMISQAQKVIAVVMDLFTDIDIFKDLLDASFKRKVPVYIIHDEANIKYFLKMCESSGMHRGMLKNLRVCSINGTEFNTRSAKTIVGRQMQKFILVDGDRAASGSYSFTWTASRLDRNIITVLSGQAVEVFDKEFRELLHFSKAVNLCELNLAPEKAEPEPVQQMTVLTAEQSAAIAKKLINPKYALVRVNNTNTGSVSSDKKIDSNGDGKKQPNSPNKAQKAAMAAEAFDDGLIIHPALLNMPKVDMFAYLPIYVELPQSESQQQNGFLDMERNVGPFQNDTAKMHAKVGPDSSNRATAHQKEATCKNPNRIQAESLAVKDDPIQNRPQTNRGTGNVLGVDLSTTNIIKTYGAEPNTTVGKQDTNLTETTTEISTQHKDKRVNQTLDNSTEAVERLQMDSNAPAYGVHGDKKVANILEREKSVEKEIFTPATGETEVVTESNDADPDRDTPPEEVDLLCLEDDCPSNPSTNYTPDWNTDSSSLHEQSIASCDSDDYFDCDYVDGTMKRTTSKLKLIDADDELTIGEVNNFVSRGTFESPLNNFKKLSHSMTDVRDGNRTASKDVNTFFHEREALRRKALDKLKLTLEINYHDKFKKNRPFFASKPPVPILKSTIDTRSFRPLHSVSRSPDLNKSRSRVMSKPMGLLCSRLSHKNYRKGMLSSSVPKFYQQKKLDSVDSATGLGTAESKPYNNCAPQRGLSSSPNTSLNRTTTPLGLSISKLEIYKNLKMKLPTNRSCAKLKSDDQAQ
ncbi:protein FAM83G-like [Heptranchias perlo]|uniref:protein FAM83G-like n=1 Tax=Heptranchias perlo TaxID=212740 RepID=UPI00355A6475